MPTRKTFHDWMDQVLYGPRGYYSTGVAKSGRDGDYFTAPDVGPVFGQLLASLFSDWRKKLGSDSFHLIEAGAGEGRLAKALLGPTPVQYVAIEKSPYRREILEQWAADLSRAHSGAPLRVYPDLAPLMRHPVEGILFANELIDAMPVHRIRKEKGQWQEMYLVNDKPAWMELSTPKIKKYIARLKIDFPEGYETEINLEMSAWMKQAAGALKRGIIVLIDYGRPAWEYYAPERNQGTLRFFFEHKVQNLAWAIGKMGGRADFDITADVDFTSLALDAREAGLKPLAFMEMGTFLRMGISDVGFRMSELTSENPKSEIRNPKLSLNYLLHPEGLGAQFHVLVLGKNVDPKEWTFEFNRLSRLRLP